MQFSGKEMAAILKAAKIMASADGVMTSDEKDVIKRDLASFGIKIDTLESIAIEHKANKMDGAEVISILSNMSMEQKKYVCGYLAAIMVADGEVDENEQKLWSLLSMLADFPTMTIGEAISYWQDN